MTKDNLNTEPIRGSFVWDAKKKKLVQRVSKRREQAAPATAPAFHSDEMAPIEFNGKVFTSRSRYAAEAKAMGYELTGGEKTTTAPTKRDREAEIKETLDRAYYMVRDGNAPLSERERERCKKQNELLKRSGG
jgi:hypothetical protein